MFRTDPDTARSLHTTRKARGMSKGTSRLLASACSETAALNLSFPAPKSWLTMLEQSKRLQFGHTKLVLSLHLCLPGHSHATSHHPPPVGTQRQPLHFCSKACIPQGDPCASSQSPGYTCRSLRGRWALTSTGHHSSVGLFALPSETQAPGEGPRPWLRLLALRLLALRLPGCCGCPALP